MGPLSIHQSKNASVSQVNVHLKAAPPIFHQKEKNIFMSQQDQSLLTHCLSCVISSFAENWNHAIQSKVLYYRKTFRHAIQFNITTNANNTAEAQMCTKKNKESILFKKKREATQLSWKFCPPTSISMQKPKRSSCWCKITLTGWNKTKFDISSVGWNSNHQQGTWSHVDILTIFTHPLEKISNWINQISSILDIPLTLNQRGTKAFLNWICKVFVSLFFTPRSSRDRKCQSILIGLLSITISQNCFPNKRKKLRVAKIFSPIETLREIV